MIRTKRGWIVTFKDGREEKVFNLKRLVELTQNNNYSHFKKAKLQKEKKVKPGKEEIDGVHKP